MIVIKLTELHPNLKKLRLTKLNDDGSSTICSKTLFEKATSDFYRYLGGLKKLTKLTLFSDGEYQSMLDDLTTGALAHMKQLEGFIVRSTVRHQYEGGRTGTPISEQAVTENFVDFLSNDRNLPRLKVLTLEVAWLTKENAYSMLKWRKRRSISGIIKTREKEV